MLQVGLAPITVTIAIQVEEFPQLSVTVSVTVLSPTLEQSNLVLDRLMEAMPLQSDDPLLTIAGVTVAEPPLSVTVTFWQTAFGPVLSSTVMVCMQLLGLPQPSVAVQVR